MFLRSTLGNRRILAADAPVTVFLLALFIFTTFTGMDLLAKAFVKQRAATATEMAMRYLSVHPNDIPGATDIVKSYLGNSFIPTTAETVKVTATRGLPPQSCLTTGNCSNKLCQSDGRYYFRDVFSVSAVLEIPPFIPAPFLREINTYTVSAGTLEVYGNIGGCN